MENENPNQVDSSSQASSGEASGKDSVAYESFRKSVEAEKRARQKAQELESELEQIKQKELEAQGKHEEIIDSLRNKNYELESTLKKERERFLWSNVTSTVKTEALKHGCSNPDKLIKLLDKDDFSILQAEEGTIRNDSLQALMEKAKKENDFLFKKGEVKFNDVAPVTTVRQEAKDLKDLDKNEIMKLLRS